MIREIVDLGESFVEAEIFVSSTPLLPPLSPRNQTQNVRKFL